MMEIGFVCLFPEVISSSLSHGIVGRAASEGLVRFAYSNPRDFTSDERRTVDDEPFGGGPGMVMMPEPLAGAIDALQPAEATVVFLDARGELYYSDHAQRLCEKERVIFVCGRYEGIDERVIERYADLVLSLGDFVLSGGELAAAAMADSIVRLLPGAMGDPGSHASDSFATGLLGAPAYTRPAVWRGVAVPPVLTGGDHAAVDFWRREQALRATRSRRPDLFARAHLTADDLERL